ncbi:MAG: hypothetical protein JRM96_03510 [Nitrososphaerota archaeon]|nr:hypothetical protein [Nitrososphaerota archaeon]MDG6952497.1 hypothetical protein [Nitrososphaerota archaeon]
MIAKLTDEGIALLKMSGTAIRLYLRCAFCKGTFHFGAGSPPAWETVICPFCASALIGMKCERAAGISEVEYAALPLVETSKVE